MGKHSSVIESKCYDIVHRPQTTISTTKSESVRTAQQKTRPVPFRPFPIASNIPTASIACVVLSPVFAETSA
eukprot:m.49950 g.49950  ORF g.49950 m.49950 type:complete len:72 (-) comp11129_c0_seq4:38-253(-)